MPQPLPHLQPRPVCSVSALTQQQLGHLLLENGRKALGGQHAAPVQAHAMPQLLPHLQLESHAWGSAATSCPGKHTIAEWCLFAGPWVALHSSPCEICSNESSQESS